MTLLTFFGLGCNVAGLVCGIAIFAESQTPLRIVGGTALVAVNVFGCLLHLYNLGVI